MAKLINHCGAERVSTDDLALLADPTALTDTHYPIRHDVFVSLAKDTLKKGGYEIKSEEYALHKRKDNLFGLIKLRNCDSQAGPVVGLRNSNSMGFLAQIGAGDHVFVCDNLAFTAQIIVGRKHTKNILVDLPNQMDLAVNRLAKEFDTQKQRREVYRNTPLSDVMAHDAMIETMALPSPVGIPGSHMGAWLKEYRKPSHPDFEEQTAWALQNAFTEVAKKWSFTTMQRRTAGLVSVLDQTVGFWPDQ